LWTTINAKIFFPALNLAKLKFAALQKCITHFTLSFAKSGKDGN